MATTSTLSSSEGLIHGTRAPQTPAHHDDQTKEKKASSSSAKVLGIPELLGQILESVDFRELFVLRRVNRTFADVILDTPELLRKAYLATRPGLDTARSLHPWSKSSEQSVYLWNPCWEQVVEKIDFEEDMASFTPAERSLRWKLDPLPPGALQQLWFRITVPELRKYVVAGSAPGTWRAIRSKVGTTGLSWARMHITPFALRFRVHFGVWFPDEKVYHEWLDGWLPEERGRLTYELEPGTATFGALHDTSIDALEILAAKFLK